MLSKAKHIAVIAAASFAVAAPAAGATAPQPSNAASPPVASQSWGYGGGYGYHCWRIFRNGHWTRICRY